MNNNSFDFDLYIRLKIVKICKNLYQIRNLKKNRKV